MTLRIDKEGFWIKIRWDKEDEPETVFLNFLKEAKKLGKNLDDLINALEVLEK